MIGYLEGSVLRVQSEKCWLSVGGVGYIVSIGTRLSSKTPVNAVLKLWIENTVHDGQQHLFGFITPEEQTWFQWLLAVSGVGGRLAMNILSAASPNHLAEILRKGDACFLRSIEGVGLKLGNRLITELKDKSVSWVDTDQQDLPRMGGSLELGALQKDAVLALVSLGYRRFDAERVVSIISQDQDLKSVEQMITLSLPILSSV